MKKKDILEMLKQHSRWLAAEHKGIRISLSWDDLERADLEGAKLGYAILSHCNLRDAFLQNADLTCADLSGANLQGVNLQCANLRSANLEDANLSGANLLDANLSDAKLRGANFQNANLDFSSGFSFSCGTLGAVIDKRIAAQMAYHFCRMKCKAPEVKKAQHVLLNLANKFHRVKECGKIKL